MTVYCLFCETAKCARIARLLEQRFRCRALSPQQTQHLRVRGTAVDRKRDLLPGYVFLYLDAPVEDVGRLRADGVIRLLKDQDGGHPLHDDDERFALMLLEKDGVIGKTPVYQEGQRIRICQGAFLGVEARILKVDRRAARMQIELPFARERVKTWVEYELVETAEAVPEKTGMEASCRI